MIVALLSVPTRRDPARRRESGSAIGVSNQSRSGRTCRPIPQEGHPRWIGRRSSSRQSIAVPHADSPQVSVPANEFILLLGGQLILTSNGHRREAGRRGRGPVSAGFCEVRHGGEAESK